MANEKEKTKKKTSSSTKKKASARSVAVKKKSTTSSTSSATKKSTKKKVSARSVAVKKKTLNKRKVTAAKKKSTTATASKTKRRTKAATTKTPKKRERKKPEIAEKTTKTTKTIIASEAPPRSDLEHHTFAETMESGVHGSVMAKEAGFVDDLEVSNSSTSELKKTPYIRSSHWMKPVSLLVFMGAFALLFVGFVNANRHIDVLNKNDVVLSKTEPAPRSVPVNATAARIIEEVSSRYHVPENEVPQVVIVTQALMLREKQDFFSNVENGDRLLLYKNTAIIFRPNTGKIVRVGPVDTQRAAQGQNSESPVATSQQGVASDYRHPVEDARLPDNPDDFLEYAERELPKVLEAQQNEL